MEYCSVAEVESKRTPGVRFRIARMSFARRLELMRQVREVARKLEFLASGQDVEGNAEAAVASAEIDRLYVRWGLRDIEGLRIDGQAATPETLAETGPEELFREAVSAVKAECGLSEEERKN